MSFMFPLKVAAVEVFYVLTASIDSLVGRSTRKSVVAYLARSAS